MIHRWIGRTDTQYVLEEIEKKGIIEVLLHGLSPDFYWRVRKANADALKSLIIGRLVPQVARFTRNEIGAKFQEFYGVEHASDVSLVDYLRFWAILKDHPEEAYQVSNWSIKELRELFQIIDFLIEDARIDSQLKKIIRLRYALENALIRNSTIGRPEIFLHDLKERVKRVIIHYAPKASIDVYDPKQLEMGLKFIGSKKDRLEYFLGVKIENVDDIVFEPSLNEAEHVAQAQNYVDEHIRNIFGDLLLIFGEKVPEFAELLFAVSPEKFRGIDLRKIMLRKFYLEIESEGLNVNHRDGRTSLNPESMLEKLQQYLIEEGKNWDDLDSGLKEQLIQFSLDLIQPEWQQQFDQNRVETRRRLEGEINRFEVDGKSLIVNTLQCIQNNDDEINALEYEIAQKGILKGLSVEMNGEIKREGHQLKYYQLNNILRMRKEKKVILADDPGLGKTLQMLVYALLEGSKDIFIGVGPMVAKGSFKRDLKEWINWKLEVVEVNNETSLDDKQVILRHDHPIKEGSRARIQLWRFDELRPMVDVLKEIKPFDFVGFDEAHWIKNNEAKRSEAAQLLKADRIVLATATPVDNDLEDLRVLLKMVLEFTGDEGKIREMAQYLDNDKDFLALFSSSNLESIVSLRTLLKKKLIRNSQENVRHYLRDVEEKELDINLETGFLTWGDRSYALWTPEEISSARDPFLKQRKLYQQVYQWLQTKQGERYRMTGISILRRILSDLHGVIVSAQKSSKAGDKESDLKSFILGKIRSLDDEYPQLPWMGIKVRALQKISELKSGQKMLIFIGYKGTIPQYVDILGGKYVTGVIKGGVSSDVRDAVQRGFATGIIQNILATHGTGATSADFSPARILILETPGMKGSDRKQEIGRVNRPNDQGQELGGPLDVLDLVVRDLGPQTPSVDGHLIRLNQYKAALAGMLEEAVLTQEVIHEFQVIEDNMGQRFYHPNTDSQQSTEVSPAMTTKDRAMNTSQKGGIDLNPANINLKNQGLGEGIRFNFNPAQLAQFRNAPGFVPVIINIQPMVNVRAFLGLAIY